MLSYLKLTEKNAFFVQRRAVLHELKKTIKICKKLQNLNYLIKNNYKKLLFTIKKLCKKHVKESQIIP